MKYQLFIKIILNLIIIIQLHKIPRFQSIHNVILNSYVYNNIYNVCIFTKINIYFNAPTTIPPTFHALHLWFRFGNCVLVSVLSYFAFLTSICIAGWCEHYFRELFTAFSVKFFMFSCALLFHLILNALLSQIIEFNQTM